MHLREPNKGLMKKEKRITIIDSQMPQVLV